MPFDADSDLIPVSICASFDQMLVTTPSPVKTVAAFAAYAKAQKASPVSYASGGGVGRPGHLTMEYFRSVGDFLALQVPYKGLAPAIADLMSGVVQSGVIITSGALAHVKEGRLKGLAVSGASRSVLAPDIRTVAESGYCELRVESGFVLLVSKGTSLEIVTTLESTSRKSFNLVEVQCRIRKIGLELRAVFRAEARSLLKAERDRWQKVIAAAGITPL